MHIRQLIRMPSLQNSAPRAKPGPINNTLELMLDALENFITYILMA